MIALSQRRCDPHRHSVSRPAYSYARAGSLWVPAGRRVECIGGGVGGSFAARGLTSGRGSPLTWPGADQLEAWYHWAFDRQYHGTLYATGGGPGSVTWTGVVPIGVGLRVEIVLDGARGTARFRWSANNGTTWDDNGGVGHLTAATFDLGNGITLAFSVAAYTTADAYTLKIAEWRDQTGNGHHFVDETGTPSRLPIPLVTPYGTGLQFDGSDDILQVVDTLADILVGGTDNSFTAIIVAKVDSTSPSSGSGGLLFLGNSANNRSMHCFVNSTGPTWTMRKWDDTPAAVNVSGGTADTVLSALAFQQTGTEGRIFRNGSPLIAATAQDLDGMTGLDNAAIGGSFLSSARGNHCAVTYYSMGLYRSGLDASTIADLSGRYRLDIGF